MTILPEHDHLPRRRPPIVGLWRAKAERGELVFSLL